MNKHFITEVNIEKLKHLKNIKIELDRNEVKHLLLTGKNGVGKTTTLEAIRDYLNIIERNLGNTIKIFNTNIEEYSIRLEENIKYEERVSLENKLVEIKARLEQCGYKGASLNFSEDIEILSAFFEQGKFIFSYFSANRMAEMEIPTGVEKVKLQSNYSLKENPSRVFVKYLLDLKTQQSFASNEHDLEVVENISAWFEKFENALRIILDDNSIKLKFDYKNYDFKLIQDGREPYGLNELSSGYSSIMDIISDLILRMDNNRASNERNYAFDTEGIVLIDEIETHLHIDLQKKILPFLTSFFPNIQFIVTTHSPFILNSIDNAVIYDLEKQMRVENLSAYSYDGIVEGYFGIDNYSDELKEKLKEYKNLAFKDDLNENERARRAELRIELKNASNDLAKELKLEFESIEKERKKQK